ncbi:MAG: hypothetical protein IJY87_01225 [Bacilli bacterium]|nr:hypothetical protein [Bacilli bacterium]MBQ8901671.1 hypothetical protein [Bacilli bacterium]
MLNKLLKYDLKYMIKNMSVFYILALFFGITTRILFSLEQTIIINILGQISVGCMFAMVVNILINTIMRSWVRFRDSIYKDEAYLTHTLPVTKNDIYNSKFIQTLIFFVVGFLIILLTIFITYYTKDRWLQLKVLISTITTGLELNSTLFVISFIAIIFLEIFNAIQCGFLGIILGHKKNNNKVAFSVLFGIVAYFLSQSIVLLLIFIVGLFNSSIMDLFTSNILLDTSAFKLLIILAIIIYFLIIILMSILCKKEFNKGVNLE